MTRRPMTTAGLTSAKISQAFLWACTIEVCSLKPGNVHIHADGHGMKVADFETSARVSAPHISNPKLRVGERILRAVESTFSAVHCNTNLGILLLCAPLAVAAKKDATSPAALHSALRNTLQGLDARDTAFVFQAIAAANPGGMGDDPQADVRAAPPHGITLIEAMRIASARDLIANEYVTNFARTFALYNDEFAPRIARGWSAEDTIARVYLHALARIPDSHIARKFGTAKAEAVRQQAADFELKHFSKATSRPSQPVCQGPLLKFDADLKELGVNPGSLADVMAAILFVSALCRDDDIPSLA